MFADLIELNFIFNKNRLFLFFVVYEKKNTFLM